MHAGYGTLIVTNNAERITPVSSLFLPAFRVVRAFVIGAAFLFGSTAHAMNERTYERVASFIEQRNQDEMREHTDYHAYLVAQRGETCSLDAYLDRYAWLGRFGAPVPDAVIARLQPVIPFPEDLVRFYREHGSLAGNERQSGLTIHDLADLDSRRAEQPGRTQFRSLGLAHMIDYVWGNGREAFDPHSEQAQFTREETDYLNRHYQVVGHWMDARAGNEAHYYIYYDQKGRFGLAYVHQDEWAIRDLLKASGARYSWDEVMRLAVQKIEAAETALSSD